MLACAMMTVFYTQLSRTLAKHNKSRFDSNGIWIAFVSSILGNVFGYFMAIFANEKRTCKRNKPNLYRRGLAYALFVGTYIGVMACCTICSRDFGWYFSCSWIFTLLIAMFLDLFIYEPTIWFIYYLTESSCIGHCIRVMKSHKTA